MTSLAFKKCVSRATTHACIVTFEKPKNHFLCNESRKSVINAKIAKFRCNGLKVLKILDLEWNIELASIYHETHLDVVKTTLYKVGEIVKPDLYTFDPNDVCSHGIHYFLTFEAAMSYRSGLCVINGESYDENGSKLNKKYQSIFF